MTTRTSITRPEWLPTEVWPFDIRTMHLDDTTIAYTDEGDGPVILLVHDGMWSYIWGQLIERLRSNFRVVTLDFPGSGLSPRNDAPSSLETDSRLLEQFVHELGLTDIALAVHDLGGTVGLGFAVRRPELIAGVIPINSFAWPPHVKSLRAMMAVMASRPLTAFDVATNLIPKITSTRFGIGANLDAEARRAFLGGCEDKGSRRRFHELMGAVAKESEFVAAIESQLHSKLGALPALTIYGEKNDPFGFQERFRGYFDNVDEMVIQSGNHFPMADAPVAVAARITMWKQAWAASDSASLLDS